METPKGPRSLEHQDSSDIQALALYIISLIVMVLPLNEAVAQGQKIEEIKKRIQAELCDKRKCNVQFIVHITDIDDLKLKELIMKKLEGIFGKAVGKENVEEEKVTGTPQFLEFDPTGNTLLTLEMILKNCMNDPKIDKVSKARLTDITSRINALTEFSGDITFYVKAYKQMYEDKPFYDLRMIATAVINGESVSLSKSIDLGRLKGGADTTKEGIPYETKLAESVTELLDSLLNVAEGPEEQAQTTPQETSEPPKETPQPQPAPAPPSTPPSSPELQLKPKSPERSYGVRLTAEGAFVPKDGEPYYHPRFNAELGGVIPFNEMHGMVADVGVGVEQGNNKFITILPGYRLSFGNLHLEFAPQGVLRVSDSNEVDGGPGIKGRVLYELPVANGKVHIMFLASGSYIYIPDGERHQAGGMAGVGLLIPIKDLKK